MSEYRKQKYISEGTALIRGTSIPYIATSEDFPIFGDDGSVDATMFTFSYERSDLSDRAGRPVLFAWNGGPGCGSLYVHMGLIAPQRVDFGEGPEMPLAAPFRMTNNKECLLDVCDLVVVDAVGTGYARLLNNSAKEKYCSTQKDAESFACCIRQWLTAHHHWNSPIYIMGESYGTIRTAMVADELFLGGDVDRRGAPLHVSGIINLGSALNYGQDPFPIPDDVLNLPSIAAANWYWHPEGKGTLSAFVEECHQFCYNEYVQALALGKALPESSRREVAEKLHRYTGYSIDKLLEEQLRVDIFQYPTRGMADEGRTIGIYDARFALCKTPHPGNYDFFVDDPSNARILPAFSGVFHGIWKETLQVTTEEDYVEIWGGAEKVWNFKTKEPAIHCLEKAMYRNPQMKLMFGMGYYDMLTTMGWVRYLTNHYDLPMERVTLRCYEGGHMPYIGDLPAAALQNDIRDFILR